MHGFYQPLGDRETGFGVQGPPRKGWLVKPPIGSLKGEIINKQE